MCISPDRPLLCTWGSATGCCFVSDHKTDPCSQIWKNRLLPSSQREDPALRKASFESGISKQGFITPHFLQKPAQQEPVTRKLLKNILSTFSLTNVDLPKMKHSKEVQTSNLFPAFLPDKFSRTSWHLAWGSLSLYPPGPLLHHATETGAWQQWCCWEILNSWQECPQKLTTSGEIGKREFIEWVLQGVVFF